VSVRLGNFFCLFDCTMLLEESKEEEADENKAGQEEK
jgi:hypothetical protein